jgi:hypothetical protein
MMNKNGNKVLPKGAIMLAFYYNGRIIDYHVTIAFNNSDVRIPSESYFKLQSYLNSLKGKD